MTHLYLKHSGIIPNQARYLSDGTGRDSYIVTNNGGFTKGGIDYSMGMNLRSSTTTSPTSAQRKHHNLFQFQRERQRARSQRESINRLSAIKPRCSVRGRVRQRENTYAPIPTHAVNYRSSVTLPDVSSPSSSSSSPKNSSSPKSANAYPGSPTNAQATRERVYGGWM